MQILSLHDARNLSNYNKVIYSRSTKKGVLDKKVTDTIVIKGLHPKTNALMGYRSSIAWQTPC